MAKAVDNWPAMHKALGLSLKGQVVNVLGFASHMVCVRADTGSTCVHKCGCAHRGSWPANP
jgi:hypothetical protein